MTTAMRWTAAASLALLAACSADVDLVLVHDAARALLPIGPTRACIAAAVAHGAALLALPAPALRNTNMLSPKKAPPKVTP